MMKYRDYVGHVTYDDEAKVFHGEVMGLRDVITFQGCTVQELEQAFKDSVNEYIAFCKERGEKPEKTFSGNLRIRIDPDLHAQLALEASSHKQSLNTLIIDKLKR